MRRFELSEGTSNKFWQVERAGASVTVCFGRIGTAGQTQVKTHASDSVAQTELDKLVKEKTKKGYREVDAGATSAPAPAAARPAASTTAKKKTSASPASPVPATSPAPTASPAPAASPAPSPASTEGSLAWTDAALREAAPIRGLATVPARRPDPAALYAKIARAFEAFGPRLDAGMQRAGARKDAMKRARAEFAGPMPAALDLDAQAAAYALVGGKTTYGDESRRTAFVGLWSAKEGGAFAVRALARAEGQHCHVDEKCLALTDKAGEVPWFRQREGAGACGRPDWRALRVAAVLADEEAYAAMVQAAEACLADGTPALRALLAVALERPEWSEADVAACLAAVQTPDDLWPLILVAGSLDEARVQLARFADATAAYLAAKGPTGGHA